MTALIERLTCPSCGGSRRRALMRCSFLDRPVLDYVEQKFAGRPFAERLANYYYELMECEQCALIYQRSVPHGDFLNELYDDWLNVDEGIELGGKSVTLPRAIEMTREVATLVRMLGQASDEVRMLDFGMGWGRWSAVAQAMGCQSFGWDLSPQRRAHARSLGVRAPEDFGMLGTFQFDAINSEQVFEHVVTPATVLRQLLPLLRPGGLVRIGVPDGRHVKAGLRRIRWGSLARDTEFMRHLMPITPLIHINTFTATSLAQMGRSLGLEPVQAQLRAEWAILPAYSPRAFATALARPFYRRLVPTTWMHFQLRGTVE